jgi:DNA topoisomerase-2
MEMACQLTETKEAGKTKKKLDGTKSKNIRGIQNLVDANYAGTEKSKNCTLILAEGLSAMSGIVSGLTSDDRNYIGIYPLKGKVLNVRGSTRDLTENKELADLIKILGLQIGKKYDTMEDINKTLRYSKIMIMSDQDLDGSHIKGLCINLFHAMWPSLVQVKGFLSFMNTPILRATKGSQILRFYNDGEYLEWKKSLPNANTKGWNLKYFKGLGTSTSTEFKEYFANKKIVDFEHIGDSTNDMVDMVFNKKRTDDRKHWLENYKKDEYLDTNKKSVEYDNFFKKEMVHFSVYDCERSIPNMIDGLKTSLRKILYCAFKRKLTNEIKVAQFSGYVSENSAYHHGEASLNGAIVNMAQDYVGSNNINLLVPNGQFGTRLKGGEDSASERYIFTLLNPLTRHIFPEADDIVLDYLDDDGQLVEPMYYVPIIPFSLVNGISGIGTGFSCNIPSFNPLDLISYLKCKLNNESECNCNFTPYYEGYKGSVYKSSIDNNKYIIKGVYEKIGDDKIVVTELPIGTWTMNYLSFLDDAIDGGDKKKKEKSVIKDYTNLSTEVNVHITIQFEKGKLSELEKISEPNDINGLEKILKLTTSVNTNNMNMFNSNRQLNKYSTVQSIIDQYYDVRIEMYRKRKNIMVQNMKNKLIEISNRAKFILEIVNNTIDLRKYSDDSDSNEMLKAKEYVLVNNSYDYLLKMPINSMNKNKVEKLMKEKDNISKELSILEKRALSSMWISELETFEDEYKKYKNARSKKIENIKIEKKINKKK